MIQSLESCSLEACDAGDPGDQCGDQIGTDHLQESEEGHSIDDGQVVPGDLSRMC